MVQGHRRPASADPEVVPLRNTYYVDPTERCFLLRSFLCHGEPAGGRLGGVLCVEGRAGVGTD